MASAVPAGAPTDDPPGYPGQFDCRVTTQTGTRVSVRPIRPDDGPRLVAFHETLSPRTVYMRFFSPHPRLTEREVHRFTHVDYADRLALVGELEGELVAVARYDRRAGTNEAEVAFVVADAWQHHGIASVLLDLLARAAWLCGIDTFTAATLPDNRDMIHVFTHSRFDVSTHWSGGVVEVRFSIAPDYHPPPAPPGQRSGAPPC